MSNTAAIILCGGKSRRMGRPKAWLEFGEEKLIQRVVRLASAMADPIVVVAAPKQDLPPLRQVLVARDAIAGRGPLEGLLAGLTALPDVVEFAYVTSTDAPFLNPAWITLLGQLIGDDDLAIPHVDGRHHPLAALYRVRSARPLVENLLASDRLRLQDVMDVAKTRVVERAELATVDPDCRTLRNINSPHDYQQALRDAGIGGLETLRGM